MKKIISVALTTVLVGSLSFGTVFASFTDVDDSQKEAIHSLKDRGIVSGIDSQHFAPKGKITYAQSLQMIVKGLDLNMDTLRFIKAPLATDNYTNIPNHAWYANAFIIAHYSGLEIPKAEVTRGQAATWVYHTVQFLENHKPAPAPTPAPTEEVTVTVEKISDEVNKVVLSRGKKPNAGYGIEINSIRFEQEGKAVITYTLLQPDPDKMYAQVITETKTETFVSAKYTAVAEPFEVNIIMEKPTVSN